MVFWHPSIPQWRFVLQNHDGGNSSSMAEVKGLSLREALGAIKETEVYQKAVLKQEKKKQQEEAEQKAKALKKECLWEALT